MVSHLGGHLSLTHTDEGALKWLKSLGVKAFLDVGCSVGGQIKLATDLGMEAWGIDGDESLKVNSKTQMLDHIHFCDFTKDCLTCVPDDHGMFHAVWSVEVSEHIEEKYLDNYFKTLSYSLKDEGYLIFTSSMNPGGHHHVTLKEPDWWTKKLAKYDFIHDPEMTKTLRDVSTMRREFIRESGQIYKKVKKVLTPLGSGV